MVAEALKESKLEDINRDNLLQALDSEGMNMPFYSDGAYAIYGFNKFQKNPRNRGRWDLKLTGQYHLGITAKVTFKSVDFRQRFNNEKIKWLNSALDYAHLNPLGITKEQFYDVQLKNIPKIKIQIDKIING